MTTNRTYARSVFALICFVLSITTLFAQKPKALNDIVITAKNVSITFKPTRNDSLNGSLVSLGVVKAPSRGSIGFLTLDSLLYAPQFDQCDYKDTLVYFICNNNNACDTGQVFFTVTCVNSIFKKPRIVADEYTVERNKTISFKPIRNDTINGTLTALGIAREPRDGSIGFVTNDSLIYVPKRDACNFRDSLTYFICNENLCDTGKIYFNVICSTVVLKKPRVVNDTFNILRSSTLAFKPMRNDTINGTLALFGLSSQPRNGIVSYVTNDSLLYVPTRDTCSFRDSISYFVCNENLCDTGKIYINVTCPVIVVTKPRAANDTLTVLRNTPVVFKPTRNDVINGTLISLGMPSAPKHGSIGFLSRDSLIYVPKQDTCGIRDSLTYFICNEGNLCDTAKVYFNIVCPVIPLKPVASSDSYTTRKNTPLSFNPLLNDRLNGDRLIGLGLVTEPKRGSIGFPKIDSLVYIPNYNQCNFKDTISYKICNSNFLCDTSIIVITVTCEETFSLRPYLANDFINTTKNKAVVFNPLDNDLRNGRIVSLGLASTPKNGSLTFLAMDTIRYTPKQDFCGRDTFSYHICNERFLCDTGFIYINVSCDTLLPSNIPVIVTFRVKLDAPQTLPVHIVGDFQKDAGFPSNWDAQTIKMVGPSNGVYEFTDTVFNKMYQYKFLKNNTWQDLTVNSYAENARFDLQGCGILNASGIANRSLNLTNIRSPFTRILVTQDWNTCSKGFLESYTVNISATPSIGGAVAGGGAFFPGDSVTVRASARAGYKFVNWTESTLSVSRDSVYKFVLPTGSRSLVANFERTTSLDELPENSIAVYPNPNDGHFTIQLDKQLIIKELIINDILGRPILRGSVSSGQMVYDVDLSSQSKGLYFINIKTAQGQLTKKILIK